MYVHFPRVSGHCLRGMLLSYPTWNTEGTVIDVPPMDYRNKKKGHGLTATDAANLDRSPVPLTATLSIKSLARSIARTRSPSWVSPSQRGQTAALPNYKAKPIPPPISEPSKCPHSTSEYWQFAVYFNCWWMLRTGLSIIPG